MNIKCCRAHLVAEQEVNVGHGVHENLLEGGHLHDEGRGQVLHTDRHIDTHID